MVVRIVLIPRFMSTTATAEWLGFQKSRGCERGFDLAELWGELSSNRVKVVKSSYLMGYSQTVLAKTPATLRTNPLSVRILERLLLGESAKCLAFELQVSASTIASHCGGMLAAMGCSRRLAKAPILLAQAVLAAHQLYDARAKMVRSADGQSDAWSVRVELPRRSLWPHLSEGEWHVALLMMQGMSHAEVATLRRTSQHTVANQIRSVFKKLGVSGRCELRAKVIRESNGVRLCVLRAEFPRPREHGYAAC